MECAAGLLCSAEEAKATGEIMNIDYRRLAFLIGASFVAGWAGWYGQPLIHESSDARSMITDVFAILAGFLMTVLTLLIEPKPTTKVWREAAAKKGNFINRLVRYKWLFMLYLIVLGLIFICNLLSTTKDFAEAIIWLERIYLGFATLAFIISLTLPNQLMQLQVDRYCEMIEAKKQEKHDE